MEENNTEQTPTTRKFTPMEFATFDTKSREGIVNVFNAKHTALSFTKAGNEPIKIVNVYAEAGKRARSGNDCQNTYIYTDTGEVYFTQSDGIGKTINEICEAIGYDFANTTNGYAAVQVSVTQLANDRTYKQLMLLDI